MMVTYNHRPFIAQAIASVLMQEAPFRIELVIGDDASTDGTAGIVEEFAARNPEVVRPRLRAANLGPQRNTLDVLAACGGEYVAILEGDDYWTDPAKLARQVEILDRDPGVSLCFHPVSVIGGTTPRILPEPGQGPFTLERLLWHNFIPTASVVFRRRTFPGFPPWYAEFGAAGDWLWNILNAQAGRLAFIPIPMAAYRLHAGSGWSAHSSALRIRASLPMLRRLGPLLEPRQRWIVRARILQLRVWLILHALSGGRFQKVWRALRGLRGQAT